ncbi:MAG TPA: hypothetical protein VK190_03560 [Pseudoneobacillus sp.]|nr:hypothetical protein [Pseudoneobacillus sp.]
MFTFREYCGVLHVVQYFIHILRNNGLYEFKLFDIIKSISIDNIDDYGCCWKKEIGTEKIIKYELEAKIDLKFIVLGFDIVSDSESVCFYVHDRWNNTMDLGNSVSELMKAIKSTTHSYLYDVGVCIDYLDNVCTKDMLEKLSPLVMAVKLIKSKEAR